MLKTWNIMSNKAMEENLKIKEIYRYFRWIWKWGLSGKETMEWIFHLVFQGRSLNWNQGIIEQNWLNSSSRFSKRLQTT